MKKLVFNPISALYEIEGEPNLIVLGVYNKYGFAWCNGDFEDIENPDTLIDALKNETYEIDIESDDFMPIADDESARALVIHTGRLMIHTGYPVEQINVFSAINGLIEKYFEECKNVLHN